VRTTVNADVLTHLVQQRAVQDWYTVCAGSEP
jgi:hypothetical protein